MMEMRNCTIEKRDSWLAFAS
uniref:Uncharacterized protein n=1 Tax=Anguilla anguilla TaxID=7936 RepID=A0A0E9U305_ANGAN